MSIMAAGGSRAAFTVRRHGPSSSALYNVKEGEQIGVRGPYGNSFDIRRGNILLVGGGTGLVPLMRLLTHLDLPHSVTFLMGAQTKEEVFFDGLAESILDSLRHNIIVTTDDGSMGRKGFVTDAAEELLQQEKYDAVYTCGPELMMYKVVQSAVSRDIFVQASLERVMKCGTGICGSCCMDADLVCKDGTVFDGHHLASSREFGNTFRTKSGIPESY